MTVPIEEFVKRLEESGILSSTTIKDFLPPKASPKDSDELALELVRSKKLTKYQVSEVYSGNSKSLVIGNYILMEKIGAGGMGQVFKARHQRMDRIVAIKLLTAKTAKDSEAISRFEREVKAAAKISHPNIVSAHDADCADGAHFLVMEYVEGSDLAALVKKNGPFSIEKSVAYVLQAALGLEAAHKKGVIHRDIKPSNLLVDAEGTVKILDMGLALIDADGFGATDSDLTTTGKIMGTVDYMSPEQALNTHTADARTDIYALGCTLYYLLAGKPLYPGTSPLAKLMAHRIRPIPSLCAVRADASNQLEAVFEKMVAKRVGDRYQTATELIEALKGCVNSQESSIGASHSSGSSSDENFAHTELALFAQDVSSADDLSSDSAVDSKPPSGRVRTKSPSGRVPTKPLSGKRKKKTQPQNKHLLPLVFAGCVVGGLVFLVVGLVVLKSNQPRAQAEQKLNTESAIRSANSTPTRSSPDQSSASPDQSDQSSSKSKTVRGQATKVFKVGE